MTKALGCFVWHRPVRNNPKRMTGVFLPSKGTFSVNGRLKRSGNNPGTRGSGADDGSVGMARVRPPTEGRPR